MDLQESPETGRDCCTPKKAKAPRRNGALKDFNDTSTRAAIIPKALRPHQREASGAVFKALDNGVTRQLIAGRNGHG
jgi:hypothetical protein